MQIADIMKAAAAPAKSRTARYMARVEAHLPTLPDDTARRAFLKAQRERWANEYQAWALRIDNGTASDQDLSQTAFDYTETLASLGAALGKFEQVVA